MADQPNFKSEAAQAFEREYDEKRARLDAKLARLQSQFTHHQEQLKKLEDQAAATEKPSKELEKTITATRNAIREARMKHEAAVVEFHSWTRDKQGEVQQQSEQAVVKRLGEADVQLRSLTYESFVVEGDEQVDGDVGVRED
jgi:chromosome segregation ATPase